MTNPYLVIYEDAKCASYHRSLKAAKREAKRAKGEVFERNPFLLETDCQLPLWAVVFKDHCRVAYRQVK